MRRGVILAVIGLVAAMVILVTLASTILYNTGTEVTSPSAPRSFSVSSGNGHVSLSWASPASDGDGTINAYRVYRSTVSGSLGQLIATTASLTYDDLGVTNGQVYYYAVSAVNAGGEGPRSEERVGQPTSEPPPAASTEVDFIDVGQGDSILIETADSKHILIDAGPEAADTTIVAFLQSHSVSTLDALVISHPDADHIGGADEVLQSFTVLRIYHSGFVKDTVAYNNFITAANAEGCPIYTDANINPGDFLPLSSSVTFQVLAIDANAPDANSASIVIKMSYGTIDFLFEGDAPSSVESQMMSNPSFNLDVEILKVGHHGSSYSTSDAFLTATTPSIGVVSVGAGNPYGHPAADTLSRLSSHGVTVYRTDLSGTIVITTNGTNWNVN